MSAMQSPAEVTDLLPNTECQVYVAAVNAIGMLLQLIMQLVLGSIYWCEWTLVKVGTHNDIG